MNDTCKVVDDVQSDPCGKPAVDTVHVGSRSRMLVEVPVCAGHKAKHNGEFAKLRTSKA